MPRIWRTSSLILLMDDTTGIMTFTRFDGSTFTHDTAVEKIALNCYLEGDNFVLELADGTKQRYP